MDMNYSEQLQNVLACSTQEAERLGNNYVGPEHLLLALLRTVRGGLRLLFKGIWVTVWIRWPIQAEDAARTALLYGKANAWIGGAAAVLAHLFQFRLRQLELAPDFLGDKQGRGEVSCRITASLPVLAAAAVWTLVQLKKQKVF